MIVVVAEIKTTTKIISWAYPSQLLELPTFSGSCDSGSLGDVFAEAADWLFGVDVGVGVSDGVGAGVSDDHAWSSALESKELMLRPAVIPSGLSEAEVVTANEAIIAIQLAPFAPGNIKRVSSDKI